MATVFECLICDYKTSKKYNFDIHKTTRKHRLSHNRQHNSSDSNSQLICEVCGKEYKDRTGLWRHKKKCKSATFLATCTENQQTIASNSSYNDNRDETMRAILQETSELRNLVKEQQKQMIEQQEQHNKQIQELIPQLQQVTNITNNTNCNNKFNLNFFLNEQCKDAISIQNFIENLNIGIPELEHMGDVGYVKGMMSIFSNTLGAMDIYKRPLHCTDLKRETLYIKQGDTWKKDTDDKTELKKLIKTVEYKNYKSLRLWEREHPEAFECDTQDNIDYMRISNESLGGFDSTDAIKLGKIMKHVVKEVYIK